MDDFAPEGELRAEIERLRVELEQTRAELHALRSGEQVALAVERQQSQQALRDSEARFRSLVQNSSDIITILGPDGRILYESQSVEHVLGYRLEEVLQQSVYDLVHPDDLEFAMELLLQLLADPQVPVNAILRYLHKDGRWVELEVNAVNHLDTPAIGGIVLNSRDVTERRRMEQALRESEERYRLVARATNDVVWDWDLATGSIEWNEALNLVFGYGPEEPSDNGVWWTEHIHPDDYAQVMESVDAARTSGDAYWVTEYRFMRMDGTYAHVQDRGYIVRDEHGTAVRMIGAMTDMTERYRTEAELRDALNELSLVYQHSADMVGVANQTHFLRVNPAFERILGYSVSELLAHPVAAITHPDDLQPTQGEIDLMRDSGVAMTGFVNRLRRKDGVYRWIEWNTTPYIGDVAYIVGRDVTERYEAQTEALKLNAELEKRVEQRTAQLMAANRELEAFSYSVSHDLRAPLRAIDGFSLALQEDFGAVLSAQGQYFLARIRAGTQRMGQLIDDMLKLSRLTRDEMRWETVDLTALANGIIRELREAEPERDVTVTVADGLVTRGDTRLLNAVLVNLLANAWKFTSTQAHARIELGQTLSRGRQTFFVRDNGVGFDMTYSDRLFGAFQRLHTEAEFEGTGIGLATVQRIIHRHGGEVWAESKPGQGATFYFSV